MTNSQKSKQYSLQDSPFYKLKGLGQLERLLGIKVANVPGMTGWSGYLVWEDDGRQIQAPRGALQRVHARIAHLLKRIDIPDYVYSKKGRSHLDNAALHVGRRRLVKTDISKFYPSTSREMVLRLFRDDFCCATDVAHVLADLCCFKRAHLPTGSPLSGYVAFLAAKPMFDRVHALAKVQGCEMSAFVDDIAVSGPGADMQLLLRVRRLLRQHGFKTSTRKSRAYREHQPKKLTGTIITASGLLLPNKQHQRIHQTRMDLAQSPARQRPRLQARLKGQLDAADQLRRHRTRAPGD